MNIATIRIKSPISDDNPAGFVVINKSDFDATVHEPHDDEAREALAGAAVDHVPTLPELLAARDELLARRAELDVEADRLRAEAGDLAAERDRLAAQAFAQDESQRALDAAIAAAGAASDQAEKLTIAQIRDVLTAKGVKYPAAANKAELQALLDAAPAV